MLRQMSSNHWHTLSPIHLASTVQLNPELDDSRTLMEEQLEHEDEDMHSGSPHT